MPPTSMFWECSHNSALRIPWKGSVNQCQNSPASESYGGRGLVPFFSSVYVHIWVCMGSCVYTHLWRVKVHSSVSPQMPSTILSETVFPTGLQLKQVVQTGWPTDPRGLVSTAPALGSHMLQYLAFYLVSGNQIWPSMQYRRTWLSSPQPLWHYSLCSDQHGQACTGWLFTTITQRSCMYFQPLGPHPRKSFCEYPLVCTYSI